MSIRRWAGAVLVVVLFAPAVVEGQERELAGRVVAAETNAGVAGAVVSVEGTRVTGVTNENGEFRITVPAGEVQLIARSIGYRETEATVAPGASAVTIVMAVDVLGLDELVVTGRATSVSRRNLANAVATVSAQDLQRAPAQTMDKALQGKVAGANIETNSGAPGGGVQVRLRGVSTINGLSTPLYVIDGVAVSNAEIPSNANAVTNAAGGSNPELTQDAVVNRIADINPNDIEKIEILKGPSAAAIYGAQAANGVVLITTKRGQPGAPRITLTQRFGQYRLSNTLGFRSFETVDEAVAAYGEGARAYFGADGRPLQTFDHEELLAGRTDLSTETALSISGGNEATRYFVSGLWKRDEGVIANTGFDKEALRLNLDQRLGERVTFNLGTSITHSVASRGLTNNDNSGTSFYMVFPFTPSFVDLRPDEEGNFPENPFERSNPLQTALLMANDEDVWRFIGSMHANWDVIRADEHALQFNVTGGADYFEQTNELFFPPELHFEDLDGQPGSALLSNSNNLRFNVGGNAIHNYMPAGAAWRATTSAGVQYSDDDLEIARIVSRNLIAGMPNVDAGTTVDVEENRLRLKDMGLYIQEEILALDERLFVSAGLRADRSSANGDPGKFFFFPKGALSYRLPGFVSGLDELKLRVAVGQSGNHPLVGQKFTALSGTRNIEGIPGLLTDGIAGDPDIRPERQTEIEGGFDATLFDTRATLTVTAFQKTIDDLLLEREVAPSSGFVLQVFNGGSMRVRGLEVQLEAVPIRGRASWHSLTTFYADRSKVLDLPVPAFRTGGFGTALGAYEIREGESATQIVANVIEGDSLVVRKVGDGMPDFRMGFANTLTFGAFDVSALVDWQQGGDVVNLTKLLFDFGQNTVDYDSDPQFVENIGPVEIGDTLTLGERRVRGFGMETRPYIEDATYVKLREVAIGWQLPQSLLARIGGGLDAGRLTLSGRNLLTFTDYSGLDPEVSNFGNQAIARNIDVAPFPPSRSFWLSVDVTF